MQNYKKLLTLFFLFALNNIYSIDFKKIEKHVNNTPNASTKSTIELSKYLTSAFEHEDEKFAAIYFWVGKNIRYDVSQMNSDRKYFSTKELVNEVLRYKKGVCQHYSELINDLSRLANLKSYVVTGYGKERGKVMKLAHAWNAIKIKNNWYFIDATWGSGYINQGKYKRDFQLKYFMVEPDKFIADHMPFDLMWQLLEFPIKYDEFNYGKKNNEGQKKFMYNDSIKIHFKRSEIERKTDRIRRIQSNGQRNKLVITELKHEREYVGIAQKNKEIQRLNSGNYYYNEAVKQLNQFYDLKQKKNKGKNISNSKLISELNSIEKKVALAKKNYDQIKSTDSQILKKKREANAMLKKFDKIIKQQKGYLE